MSLIHKSLEQLRKKQEKVIPEGAIRTPVRKKGVRPTTVALLLLLVVMGAAGAGLLYFQDELMNLISGETVQVADHSERRRPEASQTRQSVAQVPMEEATSQPDQAEEAQNALGRDMAEEEEKEAETPRPVMDRTVQTADVAPPPPARVTPAPVAPPAVVAPRAVQPVSPAQAAASTADAAFQPQEQAPAPVQPLTASAAPRPSVQVPQPPVPDAIKARHEALPEVLTEPVPALETHFAEQARRNMKIMQLERSLRGALAAGDLGSARIQLGELKGVLGEDSLTFAKWSGYLAMEERDFAEAERQFRRCIAMAPQQVDISYNLVLSLIKQDKKDEARTVLERARQRHPNDPRLTALGENL